MSYSVLYVLNQKSASHFAEYGNGFGSAMVAWDYLIEKYLGIGASERWGRSYGKLIDELAACDRLSGDEKLVLFFCFNRAYIPLHQLEVSADACEEFAAKIPWPDRVNHWADIGRDLREIAKLPKRTLSRHARGVCLTTTDVQDSWRFDKTWPEKAWSIFQTELPSP
jgi:hypothetical protein